MSPHHRFWRKNILCIPKLRDQWARLVMDREDEAKPDMRVVHSTGRGPAPPSH